MTRHLMLALLGLTLVGTVGCNGSNRKYEALQNVNLYLIGMMGSGKTSVGELVSRQLGSYTFLDTDATLEAATKRTVADIFEKDGEAAFRELEGSIMEQVAAYVRLVVASAQIKFRGASHC